MTAEIGKIKNNLFEYTFFDDASYVYKAVPFRRKVSETPQIRAVLGIEKNYSEAFEKRLRSMVRDIEKYLR